MFNVAKEIKDRVLIVRFSGALDETVNLEQLVGTLPEEVHVFAKEVKRINSIGVKTWIRFFTTARQKGVTLRFHECSVPIVEQLNQISNFIPPEATVETVYVPFCCSQCKSELVGLFKTTDLKRLQMQIPDLKCSKCGGKAVFDDMPEEYFAFLRR